MNITDFCSSIRKWLTIDDIEVYPDEVVSQWAQFTDEYLSEKLRCKHMIQIDDATLTNGRVALPADWEEIDTIRLNGGKALRYVPRDEFYDEDLDNRDRYTLVGNYLLVDGVTATPGTDVELTYYKAVPRLGSTDTWVTTFYLSLYTIKTLHFATMYAVEDDRGGMWDTQAENMISEINARHATSKASGSRLNRRMLKGFG